MYVYVYVCVPLYYLSPLHTLGRELEMWGKCLKLVNMGKGQLKIFDILTTGLHFLNYCQKKFIGLF